MLQGDGSAKKAVGRGCKEARFFQNLIKNYCTGIRKKIPFNAYFYRRRPPLAPAPAMLPDKSHLFLILHFGLNAGVLGPTAPRWERF
jgi:hypothetical protein